VQTLEQLVRKYDLVAVQEVSDKTGQAPRQFLTKLNEVGDDFELIVSERTGKQPNDASYQEAYAYLYRRSRLRVEGVSALFDDSDHDKQGAQILDANGWCWR
jgi:hypothetical protein